MNAIEPSARSAGYALSGVHDCPCCAEHVYSDTLLCAECTAAECTAAECAPNGEGAYDECNRPCPTCGIPSLADYYFCVIYVRADGETDYSDGYACGEHIVDEGDAEGILCPSGVTILECEIQETRHARESRVITFRAGE